MKITTADAVDLIVKGCGFEKATVTGWKADRLKQKIHKLGTLYEGKKIADARLQKLMKAVLAALEADEEIAIDDGKAAKGKAGKPAPAAKGKAGKKGKAAADEDDDEEEDEDSDDDSDDDEEEDADDEDSDEDSDEDEDEEEEDEDSDDGGDDSDGDEEDEEDSDDSDDDEEDSDEEDEDSDDGDDEDDADDTDDTDDDSDEDEDEESDDEEDDDVPAKTKPKAGKNGKPAKADKPKGPGIIQTIADILATATEQKPLTKDKIHERLTKKFPDRPKDSMWTTVNLQVPNKLRTDKGINVVKNAKGYYIAAGKVKAGKPAAAKPEKAGKKGKEEPTPKKKSKK